MLAKLSSSSKLEFSNIFQLISSVGVIICGYLTMTKSVGIYNPVTMIFGTFITNTPYDKSNY